MKLEQITNEFVDRSKEILKDNLTGIYAQYMLGQIKETILCGYGS